MKKLLFVLVPIANMVLTAWAWIEYFAVMQTWQYVLMSLLVVALAFIWFLSDLLRNEIKILPYYGGFVFIFLAFVGVPFSVMGIIGLAEYFLFSYIKDNYNDRNE